MFYGKTDYQGKPRYLSIVSSKESIPPWIIARNLDWGVFEQDTFITSFGTFALEQIGSCSPKPSDIFLVTGNGLLFRQFSGSSPDNILFITGHCNSNCIMCPASNRERKESEDMDEEELLRFTSYFPPDMTNITITGGEPFLRPWTTNHVLQFITSSFPDTTCLILTNGRAFSLSEVLEPFLTAVPRHSLVGIPLHASTAEIHDKITQAEGSFSQTCKGITNLLVNGVAVEIRIVLSLMNIRDIDNLASFIMENFSSATQVTFIALELTGNAALHSAELWIGYNEAFFAIKSAIDILIAHGITVKLYNFPLCAIDMPYRFLIYPSISPYKVRFGETCSSCIEKDACGGVFGSSLYKAEKEFKPYHEKFLPF